MPDVIAFWAAAMLLAVLALPITFALFGRMPDGGAGFAPIAGLLATSFGYFLLRIVGILDAGRGGVFVAIVLFALVSAIVAGRQLRFWGRLRRTTPELILVGGLFSVLFLGYTGFRSYDAAIQHTEQPMDFLFLNAAMVSPEYPPQDPWLAGERVSYYYFGYVESAVLTHASGVDPSVGYNLSLGFFFAASATAVASLAAALVRWTTRARGIRWTVGGASLAIGLLLVAGSLYAPFEWAASHGNSNETVYRAAGLEWLLPCEPGQTEGCYVARTGSWYPDRFWFWWDGSRIIPNTITEFPFFSFLLGDLHPHVMAIPGVLLALALAAHTWRGRGPLSFATLRRNPWQAVAAAIVLAALAFTNTWDIITFAGVFAVAVAARNVGCSGVAQAAKDTGGYLGPVAAVAVLLLLPWALDFSSQASGLLPYEGEGSRPVHVGLQWGVLLFLGLGTAFPAFRPGFRSALRLAAFTVWLPLLPLMAWFIFVAARGELSDAASARGGPGWVTLAGYIVVIWVLTTAFAILALRRHVGAFAAGAAALGVLLLYGAELFLIRDVFYGGSPRLNTMFKLSYQAWILLAVGASVGFVTLLHRLERPRVWRPALGSAAGVLLAGSGVYALLSVPNLTEGFNTPSRLDGLAHVQDQGTGEYEMIQWVRDNVGPADVIIEATGRNWSRGPDGALVQSGGRIDYDSMIGRVAAGTGVSIPVGWYFHEVQWRGDTEDVRTMLTRRQDMVDAIYTAEDPATVLNLMNDLDARYLVVGQAERSRYVGDLMPDFAAVLDTLFVSGATVVYGLPISEVRE